MIRVLHFTRFINRYDFIDTVIRFADPGRFRMMACTLTDQSNIEAPGYKRGRISHFVLGCAKRRHYPFAILRLARVLRQNRVDVLHTHHYDETIIGVLAAKVARIKAVVIGRHYDDEFYLTASGIKLRILLAVENFCNRHASAIVIPSSPMYRVLVKRQKVPEEKVRVIPYGFDFSAERYQFPCARKVEAVRRDLGFDGAFVVGNFGRQTVIKGQEYLLQAFTRFVTECPRARLLMVGDGPCHNKLREMTRRLGLEHHVAFTGWQRVPAAFIGAADVVAHPSVSDPFPQVMVEALVFAKPLVVADAAGPSDQVQHGRTGLLFPKRDSEAMYVALSWVATHPDEARQLGEEGRKYVLAELDIRKGIRRYEQCYEAVAEGGR
jgi:glycosyltransferase involved in cell wall biosynthesis